MVHHTAVRLDDNRRAPARLRSFQDHHMAQGWSDIAYHLGADRHGNLYSLRDTSIAGDTFTDYDPSGWLLVLADGNFDEQEPTPAQVEGVARLLAWGAEHFSVPTETLRGHRDEASTACPGEHLYRLLADGSLRARVETLLDEGGVRLEEVCGAEAEARVEAITTGPR